MSNEISTSPIPNVLPNPIDAGTTPNPINTGTLNPEIKENNIFKFINILFLFLVSRFFILCFGIFIGIGIVVKFSPQVKSLNQQIQILNKENTELKSKLDKSSSNVNWGNIKDSIILKN
jgi:hypothetical protein